MEYEKFLPNFIVCYATLHDLGPLAFFFGGGGDQQFRIQLALNIHILACT